MKVSEIKAVFPTEADLCDCFIETMKEVGGWLIYPETSGYDILAVYEETGHQLGVEAKLSLNAKVADQILPDLYMGTAFRDESVVPGPDFRAVIVPCLSAASEGIAKMLRILGVQVWAPSKDWRPPRAGRTSRGESIWTFDRAITTNRHGSDHDRRSYDTTAGELLEWDAAWHDWNPPKRCELPEIIPTVRAGIPAPVRLTPWKIGALRVMADLEIDGFVTAKSVRAHGIDARRFCASDGWLESLGGGRWGRGRIPRFDEQHPEQYAEILAQEKAKRQEAA